MYIYESLWKNNFRTYFNIFRFQFNEIFWLLSSSNDWGNHLLLIILLKTFFLIWFLMLQICIYNLLQWNDYSKLSPAHIPAFVISFATGSIYADDTLLNLIWCLDMLCVYNDIFIEYQLHCLSSCVWLQLFWMERLATPSCLSHRTHRPSTRKYFSLLYKVFPFISFVICHQDISANIILLWLVLLWLDPFLWWTTTNEQQTINEIKPWTQIWKWQQTIQGLL